MKHTYIKILIAGIQFSINEAQDKMFSASEPVEIYYCGNNRSEIMVVCSEHGKIFKNKSK